MKNRAAGFYLTLAAAILAVASIIMYTRAMYNNSKPEGAEQLASADRSSADGFCSWIFV